MRVAILVAMLAGLASCFVDSGHDGEVKGGATYGQEEVYYAVTVAYGEHVSSPTGKGNDIGGIYLTEVELDISSNSAGFKTRILDKHGQLVDNCSQLDVFAYYDEGDGGFSGEKSSTKYHGGFNSWYQTASYRSDKSMDHLDLSLMSVHEKRDKETKTALAFDNLVWKNGDYKSGIAAAAQKIKQEPGHHDNSYYSSFEKAILEQAGAVSLRSMHTDTPVITTGFMSEDDGIRKFKVGGKTFDKNYWQQIFNHHDCGNHSPSEDDYRQHN